MEVICIETEAFYSLIQEVVKRFETDKPEVDKWINQPEAMKLLRIKSKTTLQKLRDEGSIRFAQPSKKMILYDRDSIMDYLDKNAKETF